ncbi:MAG: ribosome silencing factor [Prevotella sp.]|nr:ribosome silencing factor [Prevotella sp.]
MQMKKDLIKIITKGIQEKKGRNIAIIDLRKIEGAVCNHFIICEGGSPAQIEAIAESVGDMARAEGEKPTNVIGLNNCQWVAMDYVDVIVHIFLPDVRQYYDIEHLWEDAKIKRIKDED